MITFEKETRKNKISGSLCRRKRKVFYQSEFGIDRITGKRIRKKEEKMLMENPLHQPLRLIKS